jgi:hypothetical protein
MLTVWQEFLENRISEWGISAGGEWTPLFHNNYHPHFSGINLLWFREQDKFPGIFTKLHADRKIIEQEFHNLNRVCTASPNRSPRPLHCGPLGAHWALWMTGVPGFRFSFAKEYSLDLLQTVANAIIDLHRDVREPGDVVDKDRHRRLVLEPLETVAHFGQSPNVHKGCRELAETISPDWIASLPVIPQHGDLSAGNLLLNGKQCCFVDWESFGSIDIPLYDLLTFFLSLLRAAGPRPAEWRWSIMAQAPMLIRRYCDALGLRADDSRALLPLVLVNWFHLQWTDGRAEFSRALYPSIGHYFSHPDLWTRMLTAAA